MDGQLKEALGRLVRGDRDEARRALREVLDSDGFDVGDRVAAEALLRAIDGEPPAVRAPAPDPSAPATERFVWVLDEASVAARALREGRVEELVEGAVAVDDRVEGLHPWLLLRSASLLQSAFRFTGDADLFERAVVACTRVGDRTDEPRMAVFGRALLASVHMMAGRLHAAMARVDAALELAEAKGIDSTPSAALAHQFRGYLLWEWNRRDEAEAALVGAWERTGPADGGIRSGVARVLAMLMAAAGRVEESDRWVGELESIVAEPMTLRNREWLAAVRLTQAVLVSRAPGVEGARRRAGLREVERWRRSWEYEDDAVRGWSDAHLRSRLHELAHALTLLEITRQWDPALALAARMEEAIGDYRDGFRIHATTVRAVALENLGRSGEADDAWAEALERGGADGFVRSYLDGSDTRARLHRRALEDDRTRALAERVSRDAEGWPDEGATGDRISLTPRQLDVLHRLAEGDSNRAAADRLGVSETTVKTHVRDLLTRLGAASRTQAVAIARRRGLL